MASTAPRAPAPRHRRAKPHRSRRERPWTVTTAQIVQALPGLPRPVLARLTQRLIDRLDEIDGDPDREDDDPAGGAIDDEPEGDLWFATKPTWDTDQTTGPTNHEEVVQQRLADELGLIRTPTGWRHP